MTKVTRSIKDPIPYRGKCLNIHKGAENDPALLADLEKYLPVLTDEEARAIRVVLLDKTHTVQQYDGLNARRQNRVQILHRLLRRIGSEWFPHAVEQYKYWPEPLRSFTYYHYIQGHKIKRTCELAELDVTPARARIIADACWMLLAIFASWTEVPPRAHRPDLPKM